MLPVRVLPLVRHRRGEKLRPSSDGESDEPQTEYPPDPSEAAPPPAPTPAPPAAPPAAPPPSSKGLDLPPLGETGCPTRGEPGLAAW